MQGEEIIIAKDNKPLLKLYPILPDTPKIPQPGTGNTKPSLLPMILMPRLKVLRNIHNATA